MQTFDHERLDSDDLDSSSSGDIDEQYDITKNKLRNKLHHVNSLFGTI